MADRDHRLDAAVRAYDLKRAGRRGKTAHREAIAAALVAYARWTCGACGVAHRGPLYDCKAPVDGTVSGEG